MLVLSCGMLAELEWTVDFPGQLLDMSTRGIHVRTRAAGIRSLIQGQLSPSLIPKEVMQITIEQLQDSLRREYSAFHLTETSAQYYFRYAEVHHFRTDEDELYVTDISLVFHQVNVLSIFSKHI